MTLRSIVSNFFTFVLFLFMVAAAVWTVRDIYGRFKLSERMDGMRAELRQEDVEVSFSDGQSFVVKYGSIHKGIQGRIRCHLPPQRIDSQDERLPLQVSDGKGRAASERLGW